MIAYSTSTFRRSLKDLKKKHPACASDICDQIKDKTAEVLDETNVRIGSSGAYSIHKVRVANQSQNVGKSGSYRMVLAIQKQPDEIVFLYVYPKGGSGGIDNISKPFLKELIKIFTEERTEGILVQMDIEQALAEIFA